VNFLLADYDFDRRFPGVRVAVPPAVVLGTDVFDQFVDTNNLRDFAINCPDDEEVRRRFLEVGFGADVRAALAAFMEHVDYPLAVRSSSLLEDSQYQPFAGIYDTLMLPNTHPDPWVRLARVLEAIRRVYASTFSRHAKSYLSASPYRLEEEKMAVIVQKVVGARHGRRREKFAAGESGSAWPGLAPSGCGPPA